MTFVPASISIALSGHISEKSNRIVLFFRNLYKPSLLFCFKYRVWVIFTSTALIIASLFLAMRMGGEFIPSLDEGDIALHCLYEPLQPACRNPSICKNILKRVVERFPEVKLVYSKIGTADVATDPMPPNVADTFVILKPREKWPNPNKSKTVLIKEIKERLEKEPGNNYEFTQPIQMRFNELISGIRADVAIKVYGDDLEKLQSLAKDVFKVVNPVEGAADTRIEQASGLPTITIRIDRKKLALYGLNMQDAQDAVETALSGRVTGLVYLGDERFDLVIRLKEKERKDKNVLSNIFIKLPPKADAINHFIPLSEVASLSMKN